MIAALLVGAALLSVPAPDEPVVGADTQALQREIDGLAASGGGVLRLKPGVYRSGALFFRPGVSLHLEKGAVLVGADDAASYPMRMTRIEGETCLYYPALINAEGCDGFRISGEGTVDGHGYPLWLQMRQAMRTNPKWKNKEPGLVRPRLLFVSGAKDIDVSGVTFKNAKFWTTHFHKCRNVRIHDCTVLAEKIRGVHGPSTDAIDFDGVEHAVVSNVVMDVFDDAVVLKGGKGPWADDLVKCPGNGPNRDILVVDCWFGPACYHCLTLGSECVWGHDVTMRDCRVDGARALFRLKLRPDTPQWYGRLAVSNVTGRAKTVISIKPWTQYFDLKDRKDRPPSIVDGVTLANLNLTVESFGPLERSADYTLRGFVFRNLEIVATKSAEWNREFSDGLLIENCHVWHTLRDPTPSFPNSDML